MAKGSLSQNEIAVLYLRMSDERQEHSIGDQRTELLSYAEKHGYRVLREYDDPAISGDDTIRRSGFLRMREDAAKGEFSVVLCWDQDRFGRFDPIEGGYWILPFRNAGVRLETIAQGKIDWTDFAGRLRYMVEQEGKHAYLRDLSRNVLRGVRRAAEDGTSRSRSVRLRRRWQETGTTMMPRCVRKSMAERPLEKKHLGTIVHKCWRVNPATAWSHTRVNRTTGVTSFLG